MERRTEAGHVPGVLHSGLYEDLDLVAAARLVEQRTESTADHSDIGSIAGRPNLACRGGETSTSNRLVNANVPQLRRS
ncbi:hypothetical protein [Streptomyces celluloflavus]|uniref:Uncharacterized protein n=1 Tax=Streptomyces celluloflavus TaxID=58344 RepID=A0ABW7RFS4_9ACTN|nr:hypothetical protein OG717_19120 [Streptomyces celluloflavus]